MIKVVLRNVTGPVLMLGLSRMNITKLTEGQPIAVQLSELGLGSGEVVIMFGETEDAIVTEMRELGLPLPADMPVAGPGEEVHYNGRRG